MKFSLKWMNDFVPMGRFLNEPELLRRDLTQAGLEVDSIEDQGLKWKNIQTACIESVKRHPQADRLTVCRVSTGTAFYSIVCGAKNHRPGDKAVLALPGAVLPNNFRIKKSRIRGLESQGMLCSRKELGLDEQDCEGERDEQSQEEGIWILPAETLPGQNFSEFISLNDIVLDMTAPPNRPDLLSHRGLARETASLFSLPFSDKTNTVKAAPGLSVKKSLPVQVEQPDLCPRYCGRLIEGVKIGPSPPWLKNRLKKLGLKSINNVVDITNFILWDRGQPLHAFDRDKIKSLSVGLLPVGFPKKEARFFSLDDKELKITDKELVIKDGDRILALAGIIGGKDSRITEETKNIFIESACFAPDRIRKTARRLGLETDSSYRFSRAVDQNESLTALNQACFLIQQTAGGRVSEDVYDIAAVQSTQARIRINTQDLSGRLGFQVSSEDFESEMKKTGSQITLVNGGFEVLPPHSERT